MGICWECATAPCSVLWAILWPLLSILLGIVGGCFLSVVITTAVFVLTLVRTPLHTVQMLRVTATTNECFEGRGCSFALRTAVFVAVPFVHVLFLIGITCFSATVGTLYYIGKTTQMFYNHEYNKSFKKIQSNARMEPKSYFGKYYKACQEFMQDDELSHPTIYLLKGLFALIPAGLLAGLAMVPFALAVLLFTSVRLPINVYKTMKIALFTVVLQWDLRLVVLTTLPLIHAVFPAVTFLCSIVGSFLWTWIATTVSIVQDSNPLNKWSTLRDALKDYYKAHQEFVGERCNRFDHPSGIPYGWDGRSYGIDFERILRWQQDFLLICFVIVLEAPICLIVACLLSAFKYIPGIINWWKEYTRKYCCGSESSCVSILGAWPFHVLAILLMPVGVLICHVFLVLYALLRLPFQVVEFYSEFYDCRGGVCRAARKALLVNFKDHDVATADMMIGNEDEWTILTYFDCVTGPLDREETTRAARPDRQMDDYTSAQSYWDRFVSQSIRTTAALLEDGWIQLEDVQGLEPSVIQSIPAVAILTTLVDSVNDKKLNRGDIKWAIDGTVCKESGRPERDGITRHLWPRVSSVESLLRNNRTKVLTGGNIQVLTAMLVANNESETSKTKEILSRADPKHHCLNNTIRTMINGLVLAILRVKPYQERMNRIFTHEYVEKDVEECPVERLSENLGDGTSHPPSDENLPSRDDEDDEGRELNTETHTAAINENDPTTESSTGSDDAMQIDAQEVADDESMSATHPSRHFDGQVGEQSEAIDDEAV